MIYAPMRVSRLQVKQVEVVKNLDGPEDTWLIKLRVHNSKQPFPTGKYWLKMKQLDQATQDLVREQQLPVPEPRIPRN